eukprot:TRINITY_DN10716_c0_g1_i1.p1 TRINITY_DN10716_c0_g1~~TRINITY_DN10716_c0_g1_i1.p1  ORF type:complete len:468 (-),score=76.59 TRINITY_DN10716_c0_g1_i1:75-1478(-)
MAEPSSSSSSPASSPREPATEGSDRPTSPLKKSSASLLDEGMIQKMLEEGKAFTRQFVCELPPLAVKQPVGDPTVYDTDAEDKYVSCKSISTYPLFPDGRRDGDPIADKFKAKFYKNRAWVALADGCNWGSRALNAATAAIGAYEAYMDEHHAHMKDLVDAGHFLLRAFSQGHNKIVEGKEDIWEAGTTTLFGCFLLEIEPPKGSDAQWGLLCANVGDCKAFLYSKKNKTVIDITSGDTIYVKDRCDPGGRLGPYIPPTGSPDLRNLRLYYATVAPGDIILAVSDGVHDNLDPEQLGVKPNTIDSSVEHEKWDKVPGETAERLKTAFRTDLLRQKIDKLKSPRTPKAIVSMLMDYCSKTTSKSREFMEKNPQTPHPPDYSEYPGKMDHTTAVVFQVPESDTSPSGGRKKGKGTDQADHNGEEQAPPKRGKSEENGQPSESSDATAKKKKSSAKADGSKKEKAAETSS